MNGLIDITNDAGSIDMANPVDWDAYRELVGEIPALWLLGLPQLKGSFWPSLSSGIKATSAKATLTTTALRWDGSRGRGGGFGSIKLNGTSDYLSTNWLVQLSSTYTLAGWFNCTNVNSGNAMRVFQTRGVDNGVSGGMFCGISESAPALDIGNIGGGVVTGASALSSNKWFHGLWSVSGGNAQIYLSGLPSGSVGSIGTYTNCESTLLIGCSDNYGVRWFSGYLDDLVVWDKRAFQPDEAARYYRTSLSGYQDILRRLPGRSWFFGGQASTSNRRRRLICSGAAV